MAQPPPDQPGRADGLEPTGPPAMPRWVKVSLIVVGTLLLVVVVLKLTGLTGQHGPGRHGADIQALTAATAATRVDAAAPA